MVDTAWLRRRYESTHITDETHLAYTRTYSMDYTYTWYALVELTVHPSMLPEQLACFFFLLACMSCPISSTILVFFLVFH
mgnify:CR=1 FL=1